MKDESMTDENTDRHEGVLKLLPADSVYLLLWGQPNGDGTMRMRALGNMTTRGQLHMLASYIQELSAADQEVSSILRNILTSRVNSIVEEVLLVKTAEETPHGGN